MLYPNFRRKSAFIFIIFIFKVNYKNLSNFLVFRLESPENVLRFIMVMITWLHSCSGRCTPRVTRHAGSLWSLPLVTTAIWNSQCFLNVTFFLSYDSCPRAVSSNYTHCINPQLSDIFQRWKKVGNDCLCSSNSHNTNSCCNCAGEGQPTWYFPPLVEREINWWKSSCFLRPVISFRCSSNTTSNVLGYLGRNYSSFNILDKAITTFPYMYRTHTTHKGFITSVTMKTTTKVSSVKKLYRPQTHHNPYFLLSFNIPHSKYNVPFWKRKSRKSIYDPSL